jgi:selenocysteine lyase/cysteine desulfurase
VLKRKRDEMSGNHAPDWERIRAAYPAQRPLLNLNNAAVSPPPLVVQEATIEAYRLISQNPDVNMWNKLDAALPTTKRQLADLIDCAPEEIALNRNASEGLSTAIFGIPLEGGDQVLVSPWDYPSANAAWLQRQEREGIQAVSCRFDLLDSDDDVVAAYAAAITPRTRVMHLTHMYHWNGRVLPVKRLCELAQAQDIITLVDGAQTFAQMPVSFRDVGCDFFVTSLHKWLGAPIGNGMLVVKESRIDRTWPLLAPFDPPPLRIDKFDHWNLGTYNSAIQAGIAPAIEFHKEIGVRSIHARLRELTRYWVDQARDIPGFRLLTPIDTDDLGAVSFFSIDGLDTRELEQELRQGYQVHVKYRKVHHFEGLRVSPHVYTLEGELDRFVAALKDAVGRRRERRV